ncbi:hypothetical protein [Altererythrobacter sp. Z27]|uniref:hypothetical protein n=1 Tax=Altererythrobacter sp. Z27 TaxID=3461147 RepID=UPI00404500F5
MAFGGFAAATALLALPVSAQGTKEAKADKATSAVAESWIGQSAAHLLVQWPVDRGFTQEENESTGETFYTYHFGQDAYSYDNPIMSGPQLVAVQRQGNVDTPIYQNSVVGYEKIDVPYQHHCTITFAANEDGIIHRYAYNGVACRPHVKDWGRPKARKSK